MSCAGGSRASMLRSATPSRRGSPALPRWRRPSKGYGQSCASASRPGSAPSRDPATVVASMAEKLEDLRKVKDQASKALEKGKHRQAAELFVEIAGREPAPEWHQRAGDAFRRAGDAAQAVAAF